MWLFTGLLKIYQQVAVTLLSKAGSGYNNEVKKAAHLCSSAITVHVRPAPGGLYVDSQAELFSVAHYKPLYDPRHGMGLPAEELVTITGCNFQISHLLLLGWHETEKTAWDSYECLHTKGWNVTYWKGKYNLLTRNWC